MALQVVCSNGSTALPGSGSDKQDSALLYWGLCFQHPISPSCQFYKRGNSTPILHMRKPKFRKCKGPAHSELLHVVRSGLQPTSLHGTRPFILPTGPVQVVQNAHCPPHNESTVALLSPSGPLPGYLAPPDIVLLWISLGSASTGRGGPKGLGNSIGLGSYCSPTAQIRAWHITHAQ